jgi:hypothetical protein
VTFVGVAGGYYAANSVQVAVTSDGRVFGGGREHPGVGTTPLDAPVVGAATCAPECDGYWLVAADGGVFSVDQNFYGSLAGQPLNVRMVAMAPTPAGTGYWLVGADGGVFAFGAAPFYGSLGHVHLNAPIVGMASTPGGHGYWLISADGGVFAFGDAPFYGSLGDVHLNAPIVGMVSTPGGHGYWLISADGGVFAFGDAPFTGSFVPAATSLRIRAVGGLLNRPPAAEGGGTGLCLAASNGDVLCQPVVHP